PVLGGAGGLALSPDGRPLYVAACGNGTTSPPPNHIAKVDTQTGAVSPVATTNDSVAVSLLPDGSLLNSDTDLDLPFSGQIERVAGSSVSIFSVDPVYIYPHDTVVQPEQCGGLLPTVVGTTGPDNLPASPSPALISTLART